MGAPVIMAATILAIKAIVAAAAAAIAIVVTAAALGALSVGLLQNRHEVVVAELGLLHARQPEIVRVESLVDGGELSENPVQLGRIRRRRIVVVGAGHRNC